MKVLLVNAPGSDQGGRSNPVLGLLYLVSAIKDICEVDYLDGFIEGWEGYGRKMATFKPDLVGTSMLTKDRHNSLKVLEMAKSHGAKTIVGGPHASIMSWQILDNYPFVDMVVKGEGESALRYIIENEYFDRTIHGQDKVIEDLDMIKYPAWEFGNLDSNKYIGEDDIRIPIVSSRGCTGHCRFCSTWKFWKTYRARSPENIVGEVEYIVKEFGKNHFVFEDDSLSCDIEKSKDTMRLLAKSRLNVRFFCTARADGIDYELARLIKEAGGYTVSIGFESGSQRILDIMKKEITVEQNIAAAEAIQKAGLKLCALIVRGNVGEDDQSREDTRNFLNKIKPGELGSLGCLWILPGTYFYHQMKKEGIITDDFWLGPEPVYIYKGEIDHLYERKS